MTRTRPRTARLTLLLLPAACRLLPAAMALALVAAPSAARADELRLDPAVDAVALGTGAAFGIALQVLAVSNELAPSAPGDLGDVNLLDRWVAEGSSSGTRTPDDASEVLLALGYAAAGLRPIFTGFEQGAREGWTDFVIYAEALAWNAVVTRLVRMAVRRPRPISYIRVREGTVDPDETEVTLSFFSGHTSSVATAAAAITTVDLLRSPRGCPRPWIMLASGAALTLVTGSLRVAARRHFVTDVLVGAAVGTGIGTLVPLLHRTRLPVTPSLALVPAGATAGVAGTR